MNSRELISPLPYNISHDAAHLGIVNMVFFFLQHAKELLLDNQL